ncbi:MAG: V-type ATP synthase subunit E [Eubacteriaceae bacterium]
MITVEDKIKIFSKYVLEKELQLSKKEIKELEEKNEERLQECTFEIEKKRDSIVSKSNNKTEIESNKILSKGNTEARNKILKTRNDLLDSLMSELESKIKELINSEVYYEYFEKLMNTYKEYFLKEGITVHLLDSDKNVYIKEFIKYNENIKFNPLSQDYLGGFIIELDNMNIRLDLTLKSKLDNYKKDIGIRLYEELEK